MKEQMKIDLQIYLGDIMQQIETCHDYFEKVKLQNHKKAIEVLLNLSIYS
jgi:uncharacterized protein with HEPN domain